MASAPPIFEESFDKFCDELRQDPTKKNQLAFFEEIQKHNGNTSVTELQNELEALLGKAQSSKLRKRYGVFRTTVNALKEYTGVLDVFVQVQPMPLAIIWGGLRIVVECASRYDSHFDKIKTEIQNELPDLLIDLAGCEDIYGMSSYGFRVTRNIIALSYINIFKFCYHATKLLQSPVVSAVVESRARKLHAALQDLRSNWDHLSRIRDSVESRLNKETRMKLEAEANSNQLIRQKHVEEFVKTELERAAAKIDREEAAKERDKAEQERAAASEERRLAAAERLQAEAERQAASKAREAEEVNRSLDAEYKTRQVIVQQGERLQALRSRILANDSHEELNWGTIAAQLLDNFKEEGLDPAPVLEPFHQINENNPREVEGFVDRLFDLLPMTYVFIDGLDEADHDPGRSSAIDKSTEVRKVVQFLTKKACRSPERVRIWFSSQDSPSVRDHLSNAKKAIKNSMCLEDVMLEVPLSISDTEQDIRSYVKDRISSSQIVVSESARLSLQGILLRDVGGSFLWASRMLDEITHDWLSSHEDDVQFLESIKAGLPQTITEVYEKTMERVKLRTPPDRKELPLWK
ncbi:hypothetical protein INS49_013567 [Diaporthe citri]|uniref:uncharacterized protein n=1 Tax=Diaporthe citri TaxID=83186 RepID=UPI001C802598|nr:uncharacterized protein INS49_013567 [Diaporthe citri]KAG6357688.1 hypothetical protein INS49_013567 [Diaporthe citri]